MRDHRRRRRSPRRLRDHGRVRLLVVPRELAGLAPAERLVRRVGAEQPAGLAPRLAHRLGPAVREQHRSLSRRAGAELLAELRHGFVPDRPLLVLRVIACVVNVLDEGCLVQLGVVLGRVANVRSAPERVGLVCEPGEELVGGLLGFAIAPRRHLVLLGGDQRIGIVDRAEDRVVLPRDGPLGVPRLLLPISGRLLHHRIGGRRRRCPPRRSGFWNVHDARTRPRQVTALIRRWSSCP